MFHATLSLVSQHEALRRRTPASRAFYFHRGEAIRFVTARIGDAVQAISDATIGAVAVLSITDVSKALLLIALSCAQGHFKIGVSDDHCMGLS